MSHAIFGSAVVERSWEHQGLACEVVFMEHLERPGFNRNAQGGHRCARIRIPRRHPWYLRSIRDLYGQCPEILTFAGFRRGAIAPPAAEGWWVGFHTQHYERYRWPLEHVVDVLNTVAGDVARAAHE